MRPRIGNSIRQNSTGRPRRAFTHNKSQVGLTRRRSWLPANLARFQLRRMLRQSPCESGARRRACATSTPPSPSTPPISTKAGVSAPCSPSEALNAPPASMPISIASRALTMPRFPGRNLPLVIFQSPVAHLFPRGLDGRRRRCGWRSLGVGRRQSNRRAATWGSRAITKSTSYM